MFILALGLSLDAFAAALCEGFAMQRFRFSRALLIGGLFGLFQGLMPLLGYFLGSRLSVYVSDVGTLLSGGLLLFLGVRMCFEKRGGEEVGGVSSLWELLLLAVATSVDAFVSGLTFALLQVRLLPAALLIASVTGVLCTIGVYLGSRFGVHLKNRASLLGGILLILLGIRVILQPMECLPF